MKRFVRNSGFTLIELLIVVAIIGILAAIAIPNLLAAMQRAKQKRTLIDIRAIAVAWESRAVDMNRYFAAGSTFTFPSVDMPPATLKGLLSPTYTRLLPIVDGWDVPFEFATDAPGQLYAIRSAGKDGSFSSDTYDNGLTTNFDCDIVYSLGVFVTYPDGVQSQ